MLYLTIKESGQTRNLQLSKFPVTIGRSSRSDIVIDSDSVSATHARIDEVDGGYSITDLKSTNKTYVAGKLAESVRLSDGDHIQIGDVEIEARFAEILEKTRFSELQGSSLREARIRAVSTMVGMFVMLWASMMIEDVYATYLTHWPPKSFAPMFGQGMDKFLIRVILVLMVGVFGRVLTKKFRYKGGIWCFTFYTVAILVHQKFCHFLAGNGFDISGTTWYLGRASIGLMAGYMLVSEVMRGRAWIMRFATGALLMGPFYYSDFVALIPKKITPDSGRQATLDVSVPLFANWPRALSTADLATSMDERRLAADKYRKLVVADQDEDKAEKGAAE
ncbi:MAG: FHA domain-containing protein [Pseudomonadota bacterium]